MSASQDGKFENRRDAGRRLAASLLHYRNRADVIVLALPRGGVPVGYEVARILHVPLDIFLVRKLGAPGQEELAMGAIASGGVRVLNQEVIRALGISELEIEAAAAHETLELERRERDYRGSRAPLWSNPPGIERDEGMPGPPATPESLPMATAATLILIDDGLATGSTMRAAIAALRLQSAGRIVVAVPVAAPQTHASLEAQVDELICLKTPGAFESVGEWYRDFSQTSDAEVRHLLRKSNRSGGLNVTQVLQ